MKAQRRELLPLLRGAAQREEGKETKQLMEIKKKFTSARASHHATHAIRSVDAAAAAPPSNGVCVLRVRVCVVTDPSRASTSSVTAFFPPQLAATCELRS